MATTAIENTSTATSTTTAVTTKAAGDLITADTFVQMLNVLDGLTDHTHSFYDDYTTNCNCNCTCACGRGSL